MSTPVSANAAARDSALTATAFPPVQPTALVEYHSRGRVLVIARDQAMEFETGAVGKNRLSDVLLASGRVAPEDVIFPAATTRIGIDGYLGNFSVRLGTPGTARYREIQADLILDLGAEPVVRTPVKPPGYLTADSRDEASLLDALGQLEALVGTFEKPRYVEHEPAICAHSRSGQAGCSRCRDACPTEAVVSRAGNIDVDAHLCQGCGICTAVCPTGAMAYAYPRAADTVNHIRRLLQHYRDSGGQDPVIGFIPESEYGLVEQWPDALLPVIVEELTSVGMDVWLSSLAYGASAVVLIAADALAEDRDVALQEQLGIARSLLVGIGLDANRIRQQSVEELQGQGGTAQPPVAAASYAGSNDKRQTIQLAVDHLAAQATLRVDEIALPAAAPFGRIEVDAERCNLCMACTAVCPPSAVHAAGDVPRLLFAEAQCVQCGLCQNACPEQAIQLQPRWLVDPNQREAAVVVNEERPFPCVACGKPFATQSMINTIVGKLSAHAMFQSERAKQRLLMCEDCRVFDAVQDANAMGAVQAGSGLSQSGAVDSDVTPFG